LASYKSSNVSKREGEGDKTEMETREGEEKGKERGERREKRISGEKTQKPICDPLELKSSLERRLNREHPRAQ
jgi:hypothetical protein